MQELKNLEQEFMNNLSGCSLKSLEEILQAFTTTIKDNFEEINYQVEIDDSKTEEQARMIERGIEESAGYEIMKIVKSNKFFSKKDKTMSSSFGEFKLINHKIIVYNFKGNKK